MVWLSWLGVTRHAVQSHTVQSNTQSPRKMQLSPGFSATPLTPPLASLPCSSKLDSYSPLYPIMYAEELVIGIHLERMDVW